MEATETPPNLISFKDLIEMLRTSNPDKNRLATSTLIQAGRPILSRLVVHAADPAKTDSHRVRLLKVVQSIGYPSSPVDRLKLLYLVAEAPPSVQKAATRLVKQSPRDVPDCAKDIVACISLLPSS